MIAALAPASGIPTGAREPLFFFGTLLDPDVLAVVAGRSIPPAELVPARLDGFARVRVAGHTYPMLVAAPAPTSAASIDGALWHGANPAAIARLNAYEGPGYRGELHTVTAADGRAVRAWIYAANPAIERPTTEPWDLATWQREHKPACLARGEALVTEGAW